MMGGLHLFTEMQQELLATPGFVTWVLSFVWIPVLMPTTVVSTKVPSKRLLHCFQ